MAAKKMTTADKMAYFRMAGEAKKARAIGDNSMYGENLPEAQKLGETKSIRRDLINPGEMDYLNARTSSDSTAFDAGLGVPGAAKPGVTMNPFYKKGENSAKEYKGNILDEEIKDRGVRYKNKSLRPAPRKNIKTSTKKI
jgi:hypothetical protein